jgi:hypothetical protein
MSGCCDIEDLFTLDRESDAITSNSAELFSLETDTVASFRGGAHYA